MSYKFLSPAGLCHGLIDMDCFGGVIGRGRLGEGGREGGRQTSQPFFHAIVRFSQIWREIHTLWRETWDDVILKSCFR